MKSSSSDLKGIVLVINFETLAPKCCYRDNDIYDIVLGKDVVSVGDYAFFECQNITSVKVEEGSKLSSIGYHAFSGLRNCTEIDFYNATELKTFNAFSRCHSLKNITFPKNVEKIGNYCFNSSVLDTIIIPDSCKEIGEFAFNGCDRLKKLVLGKNLESIKRGAFNHEANFNPEKSNHYIKEIVIPSKLKELGWSAFSDQMDSNGTLIFESMTIDEVMKLGNVHDAFDALNWPFGLPDGATVKCTDGSIIVGTTELDKEVKRLETIGDCGCYCCG